MSVGSIFGYGITFVNKTDDQYKVKVTYAYATCSHSKFIIPPKEKVEESIAMCCTKQVLVTRVKDNKVTNFEPPHVSYGVSCSSWTAEIKDTNDKGFTVEAK